MVGKRVELEGGGGAMAQWAQWRNGSVVGVVVRRRSGGVTVTQWWSRRVVAYVLEMMPYGVIGLG